MNPDSLKCIKCNRVYRDADDQDLWNVVYDKGRLIGGNCPTCQTPEENAEAIINEATFDYSKASVVGEEDSGQ